MKFSQSQDNYGGISRLIVEYLKMFENDDMLNL